MARLLKRTFDDIAVGDSASLTRRLDTIDAKIFAALTADTNSVRLGGTKERGDGNGDLLAHSLLSCALFSSLIGNELPGPGTRYLSQTLRFAKSTLAGDSLTATITVSEKRAASRVVVLECYCVDGSGDVVATGIAEVEAPVEKMVLAEMSATD